MTGPDAALDAGPATTRRWRLDLRYDGTDFSGWAAQPDRRTVEGVLGEWLARVLRIPSVDLVCAGRTDAGVHARGQVCHVDLPTTAVDALTRERRPSDARPDGRATGPDAAAVLLRRLARVLPADLVVTAVRPAPDGFDARFSAVWRRYAYRLVDGALPPDPLLRRGVAHWPDVLDLEAVNAAGAGLLGLRDFAAFCKRRDGATTVRTLLACTAERVAIQGQPVVEVTVRADAFCHSMVRSLVGALVRVGTGRREPDWPAALTRRDGRESTVPVLPAHGLTLEEVGYPPDDALAARALEARNRREPVEHAPDPAGASEDPSRATPDRSDATGAAR